MTAPTIVDLRNGERAFVFRPAAEVRRELSQAARRGVTVRIGARDRSAAHVRAVNGVPFDSEGHEPASQRVRSADRTRVEGADVPSAPNGANGVQVEFDDGGKITARIPPSKLRRALRRAGERGEAVLTIDGRPVPIDRVRAIDGQPFSMSGRG